MDIQNYSEVDKQHKETREFADCKVNIFFLDTPNNSTTKTVLNNLLDVFDKRMNTAIN